MNFAYTVLSPYFFNYGVLKFYKHNYRISWNNGILKFYKHNISPSATNPYK